MMGYGDMTGFSWLWMAGGFVFWAMVIGLVAWAFTRTTARESGPSAEETLRQRFARGEIDAGEYDARLRALRG